jgi:hypothetical protein
VDRGESVKSQLPAAKRTPGSPRRARVQPAHAAAAAAPASSNRDWLIFIVGACYLIGSFLWRALTPAHEGALRDVVLMTMGLDALCIVALVGMKRKIRGGNVLFWIALAAGIGLFVIRLSSDDGWWTGHIFFTLEPR